MLNRSVLPPLLACVVTVAACDITATALFAQALADRQPAATRASFPDGITPGDVFVRLDLLDRCLDRLLEATETPAPDPPKTDETRLGPPHVYQIMLACASRSQELNDQEGVLAVPTLSARPRVYDPRDVRFVVDLMIDSTERIAQKLEIADLPSDEAALAQKTPTDVFNRAIAVYLKLNALCRYEEISPNEVFAEMVRGTEDVRSILRQADPESRYRIDAPRSPIGLEPTDVYKKCLAIRHVINQHRVALGVAETPVPPAPTDESIQPRSVFIQTQIMLAELNHLKMLTKTMSSTPLAVPVNKTKVPSDVHQQASLIEHLLLQVDTGAGLGLTDEQANGVEPED